MAGTEFVNYQATEPVMHADDAEHYPQQRQLPGLHCQVIH